MILLDLWVPGNPIPSGRPRFAGHAYLPKRTRDYLRHLKSFLEPARAIEWPSKECLSVELSFLRANKVRVDVDNCAKSVMDAMNGIVYADDCQIHRLVLQKGYDAENPGVLIHVETM